jgi:hypothetical protein
LSTNLTGVLIFSCVVQAAYHALAEIRANQDLSAFHTKRSADEGLLEDLAYVINLQKTQAEWDPIITLDPMGMTSARPTISATTAVMHIPELQLEPDGTHHFLSSVPQFTMRRTQLLRICTMNQKFSFPHAVVLERILIDFLI